MIFESHHHETGLQRVGKHADRLLEQIVCVELLMLCCGYFVGTIFMGSHRYTVYPMLVLFIVLDYILIIRTRVTLFRSRKEAELVVLFSSVVVVCTALTMLVQQRSGFDETALQLAQIALGLLFGIVVMRWLSFSWLMWIGYIVLIVGIMLYASTVPQRFIRQTLFSNVSSNVVSAQTMWLLALMYVGYARSRIRMPIALYILPAVMTFALCVYVGGRSGAIFSGLALVGAVLSLRSAGYSIWKILLSASLLSFMLLIGYRALKGDGQFAIISNFSLGGLESSARAGVINEYIDSLDSIANLLFGTDLSSLRTVQAVEQPHNSYILLHSNLGIVGFCVIVVLIVRYLIIIARHNIGLMLIVLSFYLRIATDSVCFFSTLDFVVYAMCILVVCDEGSALAQPNLSNSTKAVPSCSIEGAKRANGL